MNLRRKRMMLMDGQWYGYLRTASGNPLTLQNAKRLRQLTIYGNAVQDGTPSPDAPVEVQLCGDKTGNLWDRAYSDVDANWVGNLGGYRYLNLKLKENTTYTLFVKQNNMHHGYSDYWDSDDNVVVFCVGENPNPNTCNGNTVFGSTTTNNPKQVYSFTTTEAPYYFKLFIRNYNDITVKQVFDELLPGIMLVEGSYTADTLPAYEPYGYKVSGRAEGLNLFTSDESKWQIQTYKYFKIPVDGTTTLQMKLKLGKSIPSGLYVGYTKTGHPSDTGINWLIANGVYLNSGVDIKTSSLSCISMYPPYLFDEMLDAFDIMLVQGSYAAETMPPYEPYQPPQDFAVYLPEQIAKVGDVADEVVVDMERKTAELKKKYFRYDFTGDENWNYAEVYNRFSLNLKLGLQSKRYKTPSNRFETTNIAGNKDGLIFAYTSSIFVYHYDSTTKEEFNAFLTDNPTYAYIPYSTPVTTDITSLQQWDAMPQVSGTVTLTLSAEVEPSGAEAVYYSKERGE